MLSATQWSRSIPSRDRTGGATGFLGFARNDRRGRAAGAMTNTFVAAVTLLLFVLPVTAQISASPTPAESSSTASVRISFLPPPLDGTISLGIYDGSGKLVRVLHREADLDDFEIGTDSLNTSWDGKDDRGAELPPGKYHARGYAVGNVEVEGVGFFFNDWITSDRSPRIERITGISAEDGALVVTAKLRGGESQSLICDSEGNVVGTARQPVRQRGCAEIAKLPQIIDPLDCAAGRDGSLWVLTRENSESQATEVQQWSSTGELLRRLDIAPEDPQPARIAASADADRIFLLEENASMQRLRVLTLSGTKADAGQAVSEWKVELEKKISQHKNFTVSDGKPVIGGADAKPLETIVIKLQSNPLQKDERASLEVASGFDASGSFLKTADGLPLQTISETSGLSRVVVARASEKSVDVFQDDDVVVEQFRISRLDQMMAFDCGDFELK